MFDLQHMDSQCACQEELAMKCTPRKDNEYTCWIEWFRTDRMSFAESLAQTVIWGFDIIKVELFFFCLSVSLVAQSYLTLWDPMVCSMPGFPVHHQLPELAQTHVHRVGDTIQHLILCHPLLFLLSIFPSIRVFSNDSVLCIRWPKYSSFSFSTSPSNEYSRLISFRIWWVWSPCRPRDSQESSPTPQFKNINSLALSFLYGPTLTSILDY